MKAGVRLLYYRHQSQEVVTHWGDAKSRFLGLVSGKALSLDRTGIETVLSSIESVNDVKHIAYMQCIQGRSLRGGGQLPPLGFPVLYANMTVI